MLSIAIRIDGHFVFPVVVDAWRGEFPLGEPPPGLAIRLNAIRRNRTVHRRNRTSRRTNTNRTSTSIAPLLGLLGGSRLGRGLLFGLRLRWLPSASAWSFAVFESFTALTALAMASASRLAMACFNASRVLSSWTLPSVALYSPSASSTVLSSFDDSTALTAACSVFASAFTLLAVLSAFGGGPRPDRSCRTRRT